MKRGILLSLLLILLAACSSDETEEEKTRVTPVETEEIREGTFTVEREILARAEPSATSPVVPGAPGEITFISVEEGDSVERGDALAEITPGQGESQVELQENALAQARQQLDQAIASRDDAEEAVERAKNQEAPEGLSGLLGPSEQELEGQVAQAEQQLSQASSAVESARLQVEQAEIQLEQAREQSGPETLTSPRSGVVTSIQGNVGDMATNQQPFATVVSLNPALITASITAEQTSLFEEGAKYQVDVEASDEPVEAQLTNVATVPGDTGLYSVEAEISNPDGSIKPGTTAVFQLPETVVENTTIIPTEALVETSDETFVYKVEEKKAVKVPVSVESSQTEESAVTGDVSEGDSVVTSGQVTLTDGAEIRIIGEDE
ncbi:efflux RND transporter periplasmic adaptor subunit [Salimicrobium album]|uniref:RND family efflux transporter, MFP subunit n=1 Tax=Salimicrobium album TaxID=50717 RepID=A0A1H3EQ36_9BACI|nr:efflux RND transporter periplasmic adaptor subunit [Salimicrobium album]SDX80059.1 RND family efflux transporter, MFP subunit [Salimicrobium album]